MTKMQIAQAEYDGRLPDDDGSWLGTAEGNDWLDSASDVLVMQLRDYRLNDRNGVEFYDYTTAVGTSVLKNPIEPAALGWLIAAVVAGNLSEANSAMHDLLWQTEKTDPKVLCFGVADNLLLPLEEAAMEQIRADNEGH